MQENPCVVTSVGKGTVWPSGLGASPDSFAMKAEHVEGKLEVGAEVFGNDSVHNIKPVHLGGGDGGMNEADRVWGAGRCNEAVRVGLLGWEEVG